MGVLELGGDADLAEEAVTAQRGGEVGAEDLDRHLSLVADILGDPDRGHPALPEQALEPVASLERRREAAGGIGGQVGHELKSRRANRPGSCVRNLSGPHPGQERAGRCCCQVFRASHLRRRSGPPRSGTSRELNIPLWLPCSAMAGCRHQSSQCRRRGRAGSGSDRWVRSRRSASARRSRRAAASRESQ